VTGWHTRFDRPTLADLRQIGEEQLSPALLFFKWHPYDGSDFKSKETRSPFLEEVARRANAVTLGERYRTWHDGQYLKALKGLPGHLTVTAATTVWRLVMGLGSNPAFESGLQLHSLYGFPCIPGSAVRGLVRHVAEHELMETPERQAWLKRPPTPGEREAVSGFLEEADRLRTLFGSLAVKPLVVDEEILGWFPPIRLLETWSRKGELPAELDDLRPAIRRLLTEQTGGLVAFYDAVPAPGQDGLLQVDIVNPHYPGYYGSKGAHPPSDDQDPVPVTFLAVRPGASFSFPFRVTPRAEALSKLSQAEVATRISRWLKEGLETWGAGGKTAAGYGYLKVDTAPGEATPSSTPPAGSPPPKAIDWKARLPRVLRQTADLEAPRLLAELSGRDRQEAAQAIVQQLTRSWLRKREDRPWVQELLAAAAGTTEG
jgi:CRISPR-associated protein Cmr6